MLTLSLRLEWALPDQLVYTSVSSLLWLGSAYPAHREAALKSIGNFAKQAVLDLKSESGKLIHLDSLRGSIC
jgi:hypothetical protein